ncbi:spore germination protein (amino acid permease) [Mesobacillus persicus]|uniref:Spore germination protein (Amino acid permease) n=1 Tax=Mesobacillus persicus TaxID=930146 RepID=A0A1H8KU73_9BACI|nr:GerAB/ArcD/ProY family transporter [Mesobacillus persicus]SEN96437.1 spore germination protein (amino acid permease) [Mesobacillus persicus]
MQQPVPENLKISPFMAAFVVVAMQIGIGVLGYQRLIAKDAGYDAWISVIIGGATIHAIIWMMYKICETVDGDVLTANIYVFGKAIGKSINTFFILYFTMTCVTVLAGLIEVLRTWMFLNLNPLLFGSIYLLLGIYIVNGGFRTVVGIAFFGLAVPAYLLLSFGFAIRYGDFTNLLPILDHTPVQLLKSAYSMTLTFLGFGILLFFYPFIKNPGKSKKWVHLGVVTTTFIYAALAVISFAYFPPSLLEKSIWATLEMWKIVRLPFIERFEYLGLANWALIILPNVVISLWVASRVAKQTFNVAQRKVVWLIALVVLIVVQMLNSREKMNLFFDIQGKVGFVMAYFYTPFLFILLLIKQKVKTK